MSLIVTVHVPEGIAMSAESRATGSLKKVREEDGMTITGENRFVISDAAQKLFILKGKWALGIYGELAEEALQTAQLVENFAHHQLLPGMDFDALVERIRSHPVFSRLKLLVAGYHEGQAQLVALEPREAPQRPNCNPETGN